MNNYVPVSKKTHYIVITIILAIYCLTALQYWRLTIDDAYITARYARNAALGNGLVYNKNERVMGYTNLLLTLIETAIYRIGGDGIFWAKVIGLISGGMIIIMTIRFSRIIGSGENNIPGYLAAFLLVSFPYLANNSINGLETSLFSFLLMLGIILFTQNMLSDNWSIKRQAGLVVTLFLATLARPEAFGYAISLFIVQIACYIFSRLIKHHISQLGSFVKRSFWVFGYIIVLIPVLLMLSSYYGSPLPNTFFAKTASGFVISKYRIGVTYILTWLKDIGGLVFLIPIILFPFLERTKRKLFGFLLLLFAIQVCFIVYVGGDWMPGYRFVIPLMPIFFIVLSMGLYKIWESLLEHLKFLSSTSKNILALILLMILVSYGVTQTFSTSNFITAQAQAEIIGHEYIGSWLQNNARPNDKIALMDIGRIGYISDLYVIDITGLVNKNIAFIMHNDIGSITSTQPAAEKIAIYVLSLHPQYIILDHTSKPGDELFVGRTHDVAIWSSEIFQSSYIYLFSQPYLDEYLSVYQLKTP